MHKFKYLLAILFIFVVIINSNSNEYHKSNAKKNSVDSILKKSSPFTVCADRAIYDGNNGTLTYFGNVFIIQIENKNIFCKKIEPLDKNQFFFARDNKYTFNQLQEKWINQAKKICINEKECNFISGQKLTIQLNENKKIKSFEMDTESKYKSKFYIYSIDNKKISTDSAFFREKSFEGESKKINYNIIDKTLKLSGKVLVNQNKNQYKGDKIIYSIDDHLISIPGGKNKRSTIVLDNFKKSNIT